MPAYDLSLTLYDAYHTKPTTRSFKIFAADFAAAQTAVEAFVPDYQAVTELWITESRLTDTETYTGVVGARANKDEGMTLSVRLVNENKKAIVQVPGPIAGIRNSDGTIDLTEAVMTAFMAHYTDGTILVSDGEEVEAFLGGKLDA